MRTIWLVGLILIAFGVTGCSKLKYKPYLPPEHRGDNTHEWNRSIPGIFTGKSGEYTVYGN
jgi:hypothetical protein